MITDYEMIGIINILYLSFEILRDFYISFILYIYIYIYNTQVHVKNSLISSVQILLRDHRFTYLNCV